jgi:hypothetical protein
VPPQLYGGTERVVCEWPSLPPVIRLRMLRWWRLDPASKIRYLPTARCGAACRIGLAVRCGALVPGLSSHTGRLKRAVRYGFARPDRRARS